MDKNQRLLACAGVAGVTILALLWLAQQGNEPLAGVPAVQTEAQFSALGLQDNLQVGAGTPLDVSIGNHFYVSGYNCPQQVSVLSRHRYPVVPGGNISTVMHRGLDSMRLGSAEDNLWRVQPPSEATL